MIAYFISFLLIGLPICWAEWTMGLHGGQKGYNSSPGIFNAIWRSPASKYVGIIGVIIPVVIYMYYVYIEAWCLGYAVNFAMGELEFANIDESKAWWGAFIGSGGDGNAFHFNSLVSSVVPFLIFVFILNFFLIFRGISGGIEFFCKYAVPTLVILAIVVLIRVMTLQTDQTAPEENVNNGLGFLWNPNKTYFVYANPNNGGELVQKMEFVDKAYLESIPKKIDAGELSPTIENTVAPALVVKNLKTGEWAATGKVIPEDELEATKLKIDDQEIQGKLMDSVAIYSQPNPLRGELPMQTAIMNEAYLSKLKQKLDAGKLTPIMEATSLAQQLLNPQLWLAAAGQIFFSLSVGFGVIITYSSYMRKKDDVVLSGLSATSANEFCEVALGGLITVPAAVAFIGVAGLAGAGLGTFDLGFKVLPLVFAEMPLGNFFGALWFFLLFLAAMTSSISMLQPGIAFIEETMKADRKRSCAVLGMLTAIGCLFVVYFSADIKALDTLDFWVGTFLIFVLATIQIIIFGWVFGIDRGFKEAHEGAAIRIPPVYKFIMKFVSPVFLIVIFICFILTNVLGISLTGGEAQLSGYVTDLIGADGKAVNIAAWLSIGLVAILFGFFAVLVSSVQRYRDLQTNWKEEA